MPAGDPVAFGYGYVGATTGMRCSCGDAYNLMTGRPICSAHPPLSTTCAQTTTPFIFTSAGAVLRLDDADVERIARRVVELLKETP